MFLAMWYVKDNITNPNGQSDLHLLGQVSVDQIISFILGT